MAPGSDDLIGILRLAYSGELAAAYAYRGHWKSVKDSATRTKIREIEEEEWHHRRLAGQMLSQLGSGPSRYREIKAVLIGRTLGMLCHVMGWLLPMYGAGRLESRNVGEYERAARYAAQCNRHEFVECLLAMAEVEWEHEIYFRRCVQSHRLSPRIPMWRFPAPKESIRSSFYAEMGSPTVSVTGNRKELAYQPGGH
jgi:rubrerythrin